MWNAVVLTSMAAMTGLYALMDTSRLATPEQANAGGLAQSMAIYRQAVVTYHQRNPGAAANVSMAELTAPGPAGDPPALPAWSRLNTDPSIWQNHKDVNGMVYIYATPAPPVNLVPELLARSYGSELVTVFRVADNTLRSPVPGPAGSQFPAPGGVAIPDGSPVWLASAQ